MCFMLRHEVVARLSLIDPAQTAPPAGTPKCRFSQPDRVGALTVAFDAPACCERRNRQHVVIARPPAPAAAAASGGGRRGHRASRWIDLLGPPALIARRTRAPDDLAQARSVAAGRQCSRTADLAQPGRARRRRRGGLASPAARMRTERLVRTKPPNFSDVFGLAGDAHVLDAVALTPVRSSNRYRGPARRCWTKRPALARRLLGQLGGEVRRLTASPTRLILGRADAPGHPGCVRSLPAGGGRIRRRRTRRWWLVERKSDIARRSWA